MPSLTPMMQQYLQIKEKYKDCLLFFRLGDFYEMFFEDAITASKELEITLTGRDCGMKERAPMCGVPYHSVDNYINRLIEKGYKIAICEQLSDPAETVGIVERDVIRVITPGTVISGPTLDEKKNNYLVSLYKEGDVIGIASTDVSTGEFNLGEIDCETKEKLWDELARLQPTEIIVNQEMLLGREGEDEVKQRFHVAFTSYHEWAYDHETAFRKMIDHFNVTSLDGYGCQNMQHGICAAGGLLEYLTETQKNTLIHINHIRVYHQEEYMILDASTRRNLELTETIRGKNKKGSLLWLLDKTVTAMGGRLLRQYIEQPLIDEKKIIRRLGAVAELCNDVILRDSIRDELKRVYDIERLVTRISYGTVNARDCISLKQSISLLPDLKKILSKTQSDILMSIHDRLDPLEDVFDLLECSIAIEPPVGLRDGGIIKSGFLQELDTLRQAARDGKEWITNLEAEEKEKTGIKTLKINYNKVFGYFIDVTKSYLHLVPDRYMRKQTLANSERYITPELKEMENTILNAEEKSMQLEYEIFCQIRENLSKEIQRIQKTAHQLAKMDVLQSLAAVASENDYVKPEVHGRTTLEIIGGRHPVVEKTLANGMFVPNDTKLDQKDNRVAIITGPNMAGKSTYMRQVALITLMAHIGSFVPAKSARISITDRIFTRVGASDDLSSGQSTFMVEMNEVANILHNASSRSLLILDEIGRGTSTFDGLSIAWAVVEHICNENKIGAKTLFATHYHELTELEGRMPGVKNYCISVKEHGEDVIFLRKIIRGGADKSFGIQVARLAGLPADVIARAKEILEKLEASDVNNQTISANILETSASSDYKRESDKHKGHSQIDLFDFTSEEIIEELKKLDIFSTTPLEAINILYKLYEKAKKL